MVNNERGVTLAEVLASVVILVLIITVFMNLFLTSARTNNASENIVDYTFIAQRQMEEIYEAGQGNTMAQLSGVMTGTLGFTALPTSPGKTPFEKTGTADDGSSYVVKVTFNDYVPSKSEFNALKNTLKRTVVEVRPADSGQSVAKMEGLVEWRGTQ